MTVGFIRSAGGWQALCVRNKAGGHRPPLQQYTLTAIWTGAIDSHQMKTDQPILSRRTFLLAGLTMPVWRQATARDPWSDVPTILARIKPPTFAARDLNVVQFGATANSSSESTDAIAKAISACSSAGGGRVVIPAG